MNEKNKLICTIILILLILFIFNIFKVKPLPTYKILKVENADEFYIDLNKNQKIDDNEFIKLYDINAFHDSVNKNTFFQSKKLELSQNEILALGVLAKDFAQKEFTGKLVQIEFFDTEESKYRNYLSAKLYLNKKDIAEILLNNGFAISKRKEKTYKKILNFVNLEKQLKKIKNENILIFDEKTNIVHKIDCKHSLTIKNARAIKNSDIIVDAVKCKDCFGNQLQIKKDIIKEQIKKIEEQQKEFIIKDFDFELGVLKFYFTDFNKRQKPDNDCKTTSCKVLLEQINNTQSSIDFALYGIANQPKIINALVNAQNRGVKIRWVTDADMSGKNIYKEVLSVQKLLPDFVTDNHDYALIGTKNPKYTNSIMHNKFFIFDNNIVWLGSSNLSQTDLADFNANINILAKSEKLAHIYKQEFEQMYNKKFHELKSSILNKENLNIGNEIIVSIYFSPTDKIITNYIIPAINKAQKNIYISSFIITHKKVENALISAKTRGVDIKVITDATSANGKYSIHNSLRSYNIPVKIENKAGKMHSKSIIIDEKSVFIGSMNLTKSGENKNDENVILIHNNKIAQNFKEQFLYLYSSIPDLYLTKTPRAEGWESIGSCNDGIDNNFDGLIDGDDIGCK